MQEINPFVWLYISFYIIQFIACTALSFMSFNEDKRLSRKLALLWLIWPIPSILFYYYKLLK